MAKEDKEAEAKLKADTEAAAKVKAESEAKAKQEAKEARAEAEAGAKMEAGKAESKREAEALGVKKSRVTLAGFKDKGKPEKLAAETKRQEKLVEKRTATRIAKAKEVLNIKPSDKRKALLVARFKAVKSRKRPTTYSNKNIEAWLEEYNLIMRSPKSWNKITRNGTLPYSPGNKKKRSAKDILDSMDLED